eukprot:3457186-Prorocentrum_lima.AAC.1
MTSSLVGSEMCIRDRSHPCHPQSLDACTESPPSHAQSLDACMESHPGNCLLYTSDAADDM